MKKKIIIIIVIILLAAAGIAVYFCARGIETVTINNKEYDVDSLYEEVMKDNALRVFEDDTLEQYVTYSADISEIENRTLWIQVQDYIQGKEFSISYSFEIDTEGVLAYLEEYNKSASVSEDAYITAGETEYIIVSEVYGEVIDVNSYMQALNDWIASVYEEKLSNETEENTTGQQTIDTIGTYAISSSYKASSAENHDLPDKLSVFSEAIEGDYSSQVLSANIYETDNVPSDAIDTNYAPDPSDYLVKPNVLSTDLENELKEINKYVNWSCTYTNGYTISSNISYVTYEDGDITVDSSWIKSTLSGNLASYNTVGGNWEFLTSAGEMITVSGGTWGSSVSYSNEASYLVEQFEAGVSVTDRIPEYNYNRDDIGNTYVEVSIQDQHVWVYWDGEMIMESDCVTGDVRKGHDTPTGVYYISECIPGKYLVGDDYETWVNRWMRLTNSGVGLHDAYWRSSFGGSVYKTNGSHGCINLPSSFAYNLYDLAYVGMPVIIY